MVPRLPQVNFSKGELGPYLYGRFDVESYQSALKTARNVIVMKYGGVSKRPGTWLVGEVIGEGNPVRLIPFQFSLNQAYALEFGEGYIAPCLQGGRLLEGELAITAITNAANAQVTIQYHGYAVGDYLFLQGIAGALGNLLNDRVVQVVSVIDANTFTINVNTSMAAAFTSCTGGTTNTSAPAAPMVPTVGSTAPVTVTATSSTTVAGGGYGGGAYGRGFGLK
jgi:hypothetical protein